MGTDGDFAVACHCASASLHAELTGGVIACVNVKLVILRGTEQSVVEAQNPLVPFSYLPWSF
jgi:hypothetical protein